MQEVTKFFSLSQRVIIQSSSVSVKQKETSQYSRNNFVETVALVARLKKKSYELNPYVKECVQTISIYIHIIYIIVFINVRGSKIYLSDFLTWYIAILNYVLPLDLTCHTYRSSISILFFKSRIRISFLSIVICSLIGYGETYGVSFLFLFISNLDSLLSINFHQNNNNPTVFKRYVGVVAPERIIYGSGIQLAVHC